MPMLLAINGLGASLVSSSKARVRLDLSEPPPPVDEPLVNFSIYFAGVPTWFSRRDFEDFVRPYDHVLKVHYLPQRNNPHASGFLHVTTEKGGLNVIETLNTLMLDRVRVKAKWNKTTPLTDEDISYELKETLTSERRRVKKTTPVADDDVCKVLFVDAEDDDEDAYLAMMVKNAVEFKSFATTIE
jgi:hypothetical protein